MMHGCSLLGMGAGWWPVALAVHLAFWGFVAWAAYRLLRPWLHRSQAGPERVLRERFARGAIDEDEYRSRLAVLQGGSVR